ncbi:MAG: hypothetical protein JSU72_02320 [Deltaproteobacteria bacterium]|nr:MAG: hypothetical protein JSU72_02320 [Deltaproteobacteria bacterium]
MERHQVIVLEDPPSFDFPEMLGGAITISEYIMELDSGFPQFERRLCSLLRELCQGGRRIIQVEPYLETLLRIHELFAAGKTVDHILQEPILREVYLAERRATGRLISYYARSVDGSFEVVVQAVKDFARADAARLTLRERLRAKAIADIVRPGVPMYVEAGYIHYPLYQYLRRELGKGVKIRPLFLLAPVVTRLKGKRRNMGPGDILTLHYAFHHGLREEVADLLAARSLIYIKLIQKEELLPDKTEAPHAEDEVRVNRLVDSLQFNQCRELFEQIRLAKRERAVQLAQVYIQRMSTGSKVSGEE